MADTYLTRRKPLEDKLYKNVEEEIKTILRTTIDGFYLVDIEGRILDTNDSYCTMIGYSREELIGMRIKEIEAVDTEEVINKRIQQILETGYARFETRHRRKDGRVIAVEASVNYLTDEQPKLFCFMRDISDRKEAEETLRLEKDNFRHSLDDSPLGIRIVSQQGKTIYVNQTLLDFYGFDSLEELQKVPLENRYTHESFVEAQERKTARVNGTFTATNYNVSILAKNGEIRHLKGYSKKVLWDGIWQFQIIYEDITEIKKREFELESSREQLEQLNLYLQRVREEERKRISRELHDELGQALTAIKIDLGILKNNIINQNNILPNIDKISSLLNDSIITVQRLTSELRPHILDDLGLVPAIEWYTGEYIKRTGISINLDIDKSISLPTEIELVIFRILQESLTNIARHSKAGTAEIFFYRQKSDVLLEIKDDGIGISAVDRKSPKSLGLFNMNERAREIGGTFVIESRKKRGTRICLTVPDILFEE